MFFFTPRDTNVKYLYICYPPSSPHSQIVFVTPVRKNIVLLSVYMLYMLINIVYIYIYKFCICTILYNNEFMGAYNIHIIDYKYTGISGYVAINI